MKITLDNKVEIAKEVIETINLITLDTEIAHLQDSINQLKAELVKKQSFRNEIVVAFPELEVTIYADTKKQ
jgi:uncharacterized small protein (DUF1192 family)